MFELGGLFVRHGFNKNAAEIGHIVIQADGVKDNRGVRGSMEGLSARPAIARDIKLEIKDGKKTLMSKKMDKQGTITSGAIRECYEAGDKVVTEVVNRAAKYLGLGLGSLINVISPDIIVMGGGVVEALGEPFIKLVEKAARKVAFDFAMKDVKFVKAQLGDDAGITGAAMLAREALKQQAKSAS